MAYSYSQEITISASLCGSSNSTNFPFLFGGAAGPYTALETTAHGGNIQNTVTFNGQTVPADLIFTSDSGGTSLLSWEVASYNASTGDIEVWIQIPTLSSMTNTVIYMFAGNASVSTYQGGSVGAAWNSNFGLVTHLANGSTLSTVDSTSNATTLTNNSASAASGQIDGAASGFNGESITAPANTSSLQPASALTVQCWAKVSSNSTYAVLVDQEYSYPRSAPFVSYQLSSSQSGSNTFSFDMGSSSLAIFHANSGITSNDNVWHFIVGTYDGSNLRIYVDGSLKATTAQTGLLFYYSSGQFWIGNDPSTEYPIGSIDEVRVLSVANSASWITAEYNNQSSPSTFYTLANIPSGSTSTNQLMLMGCGM